MFPRRSDRNPVLLAIGAGLLVAACVDAGEPGVDVQALQADVAFGFEAPAEDEPIAPVTEAPQTASSAGDLISDGSLNAPFRNDFADRFKDILRIPTPPADSDCPSAPIGASPAQQAPEEVTTLPEEGLYLWLRDIKITSNVGGTEIEATETGFESRVIRAVEELGAGTNVSTDPAAPKGKRFTYETVAPAVDGRTLINEWLVNTQPLSRGANVSQDPEGVTRSAEGVAGGAGVPADVPDGVQDNLPGGQRVETGEPNRGLVLLAERATDGNGADQGSFNPSPPLLYLPLPVGAGSTWTSTGVDATSGETRRIDGAVYERASVDACGTMLDGWLVEISETRATPAGVVSIAYEAVVSTELGGVIIAERFTAEDGAGTSVEADYRRGQVEPEELPEDLR